MVEKIDSNYSAVFLARLIDQVGAGAVELKTDPVPQKAAVSAISTYDLQFRVNTETHEITAVIVDTETRDVIREVPAKEMRAAADVIRSLLGPLVDKTI